MDDESRTKPLSTYRWIISRDMYWEEEIKRPRDPNLEVMRNEAGTTGPWNANMSLPLVKCFRMYVQDDEHRTWIYEGWASEECDFEPLDDFGRPNFGCEGIVYWNERTLMWEDL